MPSLWLRGLPAGARLSPLLRGAGLRRGRPRRPSACSRPPLAPAAASPPSGARVGRGAGPGRDAGPESVTRHAKSKELHLAPIGSGAARGQNSTTFAGICPQNGCLRRTGSLRSRGWRLQSLNFPGVRRRRSAAGTGSEPQGATGRPSLLRRPSPPPSAPPPSPRGAARTPCLVPAPPKLPALGRGAAALGATERGTRGRAVFSVLLSRRMVLEVGPRRRPPRRLCTLN